MELGNRFFGNSRREYPISRGYDHSIFHLFAILDMNHYGTAFENKIFSIAPYWWGECNCGDEHEQGCIANAPNFHYKPTDFQLQWYKYPLRDSYSNKEISRKEFAKMIAECVWSVLYGEKE